MEDCTKRPGDVNRPVSAIVVPSSSNVSEACAQECDFIELRNIAQAGKNPYQRKIAHI
jgi:hypothetical protein